MGLAYAAWQRREMRAATPFALYSLSYAAWMFAAGLLWLSPSRTPALLFDLLTELLGTATMVAWVLFVIVYTDQRDRFIGWRLAVVVGYVAIYLVRIAVVAVIWFTGSPPPIETYQGLTIVATRTATEPQPYGVATVIAGLSILFWSFYLLWQFYRSEIAGQRQQAGVTLLAGVAPSIVYTGYIVGDVTLHPHLDPTPLFFTIAVVGTWFALFVYDFLDIEPVAANTLFETMSDPVVILDADQTVLNANSSAQSLGISVDKTLASPLFGAINTNESEVTLETASGDERVFDLSVSSLGEGQRYLVVLRDITLRTAREEELERQNDRLDEFASVVSHDLRNPLTVAEGNLTLLEETGDREQIESIRDSHRRMETIIDDLLSMARSGETVEETEPIELQAVTTQAFEQVPTAETELSVSINASTTVEADRNKLLQLFENLFRNSVEHNDEPVTISVTIVTDDAGNRIGFAVEDNGCGIPPAEREQIFEHGYTKSDDGTGFGLSIVESIAAAHGWEIHASDGSDGGARFKITGCRFPAEIDDRY